MTHLQDATHSRNIEQEFPEKISADYFHRREILDRFEVLAQHEDVVAHAIDVVYAPTPENPAHSQIIVKPEFFGSKNKQKNVFKLLQLALAELAEKKRVDCQTKYTVSSAQQV